MLSVAFVTISMYMPTRSERKHQMREERRQRNIARRQGRYVVCVGVRSINGVRPLILFTSDSREDAQQAAVRLQHGYHFTLVMDRQDPQYRERFIILYERTYQKGVKVDELSFDWRKEGF